MNIERISSDRADFFESLRRTLIECLMHIKWIFSTDHSYWNGSTFDLGVLCWSGWVKYNFLIVGILNFLHLDKLFFLVIQLYCDIHILNWERTAVGYLLKVYPNAFCNLFSNFSSFHIFEKWRNTFQESYMKVPLMLFK